MNPSLNENAKSQHDPRLMPERSVDQPTTSAQANAGMIQRPKRKAAEKATGDNNKKSKVTSSPISRPTPVTKKRGRQPKEPMPSTIPITNAPAHTLAMEDLQAILAGQQQQFQQQMQQFQQGQHDQFVVLAQSLRREMIPEQVNQIEQNSSVVNSRGNQINSQEGAINLHTLIKYLPKFKGTKDENFDSWADNVRLYLSRCPGISEKDKMTAVLFRIEGDARQIVANVNNFKLVDDIITCLEKTYKINARSRLASIQQGKEESAQLYYSRLRSNSKSEYAPELSMTLIKNKFY